MAHMMQLARICHQSEEEEKYFQMNVAALAPMDALKVVLEQAMYAHYLRMASSSVTIPEYISTVREMFALIPFSVESDDPAYTTIYDRGLRVCSVILESLTMESEEATRHLETINPTDVRMVFRMPTEGEYRHREYLATMTDTFCTEWCAFFLGKYDNELYPAGVLADGAIFVPSVETFINYDPARNKEDNQANNTAMLIDLTPMAVGSFKLNLEEYPKICIHCFIQQFNMQDRSVDDLVGLLASFAIDHDPYYQNKYGMAGFDREPKFRVTDICFDLVTGSDFVPTTNNRDAVCDKEYFLDNIQKMLKEHHIRPVEDYTLFGELIRRLGETLEVVNFFIKPVNAILAAEALAFRSSVYAGFIQDRVFASMEAVGEDTVDDTDTEDDQEVAEDSDDGSEDQENNDVDADEADVRVDKKPVIDPDQMMLELAGTKETLSDYIFRETVARRISNLLKNPPENAMPNDLLTLKRWKSRWLFLASVACIRDFLTRISLRLSDA